MPLLVNDQRTAGWKSAREGRITASVAAGCLGLNPLMSRQKAFRMIMGYQREVTNWWAEHGIEFEGKARNAYEVETGNLVQKTGFWVHDRYDWLGASPDGLIGDDGVLEIKCLKRLPTSVPIYHRIQALIEIEVTGRKWCDYFVWTVDGTFHRRIYASPGTAGIVARLEQFYRTYITAHAMPERKKPKRRKIGRTSGTTKPAP